MRPLHGAHPELRDLLQADRRLLQDSGALCEGGSCVREGGREAGEDMGEAAR